MWLILLSPTTSMQGFCTPSFTLKWGRSFLSYLDERRDKRSHYFSLKYDLRPPNFPQLISEQFLGKNMLIIGSYERICDQRLFLLPLKPFFKDWYVEESKFTKMHFKARLRKIIKIFGKLIGHLPRYISYFFGLGRIT